MQILAAGVSDVGQQREHNEDSFAILPEFDLYIVAVTPFRLLKGENAY